MTPEIEDAFAWRSLYDTRASCCRATAARLHSAAYAVVRCLSVCLSRSSYRVETRKHIIKFLSPSGSHTILVFRYQTLWQYSDGDPLTGVKIAIFDQYLALGPIAGVAPKVVNSFRQCGKLITPIFGVRL